MGRHEKNLEKNSKGDSLTEAEHIGGVAERLVEKHLRCHVLVCTTNGHLAVA